MGSLIAGFMTRFRLLLFVLAVALAGAAGIGGYRFATGRLPWHALRGVGLKAISPDAARKDVETVLQNAPDYAPFFAALKTAFPNDHARLLAKFASRRALAGASESADLYVTEAVSSLSQTRGSLAARASTPALESIFTAQAKIATALSKTDARLCVDFIYGNVSQGYFDFAARNRPLVAEMAGIGLDAILDGQKTKAERGGPSEADLTLFETALTKSGMSAAEIAAFVDGKSPEPPIADTKLCAAGLTYFSVLEGLDEAVRLRIYGRAVELMAKS